MVTCAAIVLRNLWTIEFQNFAYRKLDPVKEEISNFSACARERVGRNSFAPGITGQKRKAKKETGRLFGTDLRIYEPRHRLPVTSVLREI